MKTRASTRRQLEQSLIDSGKPEDCFARLRSYQRSFSQSEVLSEKLKRASVLVPLFIDEKSKEIHVILTLRSEKLKAHPGEVCLPGGREELNDEKDPVKTAIRETTEEIGLDSDQIIEGIVFYDCILTVKISNSVNSA